MTDGFPASPSLSLDSTIRWAASQPLVVWGGVGWGRVKRKFRDEWGGGGLARFIAVSCLYRRIALSFEHCLE